MERLSAQPAKRKIKKEAAPVASTSSASSSSEAASKKPAPPRDADDSNGPGTGPQSKDYVSVSPETISVIAESLGLTNLGEDVATSLAEDVSYKLQEIINVSCTVMRQSKRRKLLTSDVNAAFRISDVNHIFGHARNEPFKFLRIPEAEIFIPEENEVDLISMATETKAPKVKKPSFVATSFPLLKNIQTQSLNGHSAKSDGKSFTFQQPKSSGTNGVDSRSKLNGGAKVDNAQAVKERLKRDTEEELKLSQAQLHFFNVVAKCIIEGHDCLYKQALTNLKNSNKLNPVSVPLLNFVALSVCHIPRHFGLLSRLLETVEVLLSNRNVNPTYSIAVNRLVNALLAIIADQNVLMGNNDFLLRQKAAHLLTRVLLVWGIEEQHVSELLSRVALILGDSKEKVQSHYGALVIFQSLGKAAIGWLSPLLKSFVPLLEKRYPHSGVSNIQIEEIRGTLLDIVELLFCEVNSNRFKIKASTIQETQAMIALDAILYQYCGDAVCARRRSTYTLGQSRLRSQPDRLQSSCLESELRLHHLNFRYMSHCTQKQRHRQQTSEVFEEMCATPIIRRKDIQFKFAGANPVPKDGLRKKVLDKTHVQFTPVASNPFHSLFPKQHLMVGHMPNSRFRGITKQLVSYPYNLLSVL